MTALAGRPKPTRRERALRRQWSRETTEQRWEDVRRKWIELSDAERVRLIAQLDADSLLTCSRDRRTLICVLALLAVSELFTREGEKR